jgi:hypothetical protein
MGSRPAGLNLPRWTFTLLPGVLVSIAILYTLFLAKRRWSPVRGLRRNRGIDPGLTVLLRQTGFFSRALAVLERAGLPKPEFRPPVLHAENVGTTDPLVADRFRALSGLYYRVRFGRHALSPAEESQAMALLGELSNLLDARRRDQARSRVR